MMDSQWWSFSGGFNHLVYLIALLWAQLTMPFFRGLKLRNHQSSCGETTRNDTCCEGSYPIVRTRKSGWGSMTYYDLIHPEWAKRPWFLTSIHGSVGGRWFSKDTVFFRQVFSEPRRGVCACLVNLVTSSCGLDVFFGLPRYPLEI